MWGGRFLLNLALSRIRRLGKAGKGVSTSQTSWDQPGGLKYKLSQFWFWGSPNHTKPIKSGNLIIFPKHFGRSWCHGIWSHLAPRSGETSLASVESLAIPSCGRQDFDAGNGGRNMTAGDGKKHDKTRQDHWRKHLLPMCWWMLMVLAVF